MTPNPAPAPISYTEADVVVPIGHPRPYRLARAFWPFCAGAALLLFLLSVTVQLTISAGDAYGLLSTAGSPALDQALNIAGFLGYTAAVLICLLLAGVLFVKRPHDSMALFLAYFLLCYGLVMGNSIAYLEPFWPGIAEFNYVVLNPGLLGPLLVIFLAVFPDGRFMPRWTRRLVIAALLYGLVSPFLLTSKAHNDPTILYGAGVLLWFGLLFTGLFAQIVRFRTRSNATQRQQTKWFIFGFAVALALAVLLTALTITAKHLELTGPAPMWSFLVRLGWSLAMLVLPLSLTLAVLRRRLYDIDLIINRTLVYGTLTVVIVAVYVLLVGGLGSQLQARGDLWLSLVATGLIAVLFQPLREGLQRIVNRLMFGERDEPFEALARLGRRLESLSPDAIYAAIVETVAQALKLPHVAVAVMRGESFAVVGSFGPEVAQTVTYPLLHQGETVGRLQVARRHPDEPFAKGDERLLRSFCRQAGSAVYAARLMADLQLSRQQLVSAREEERRRLRRDLHDGLGPALASIAWQAEGARDLIGVDPADAWVMLASSIAQARSALADIRRLVYNLRPPALDELGLVGALAQTALQYRQTAVTVKAAGPLPDLPAAVEVAAYRIAQEAIKNAADHGRAQHCEVSLSVNSGLSLSIRDDGGGLPPELSTGVGLLSMRERAEELDGTFVIRPRLRGGTAVEVALPLQAGA